MAILDQLRAEFNGESTKPFDPTSGEARPGFGRKERELAGRVREALAGLATAAWATSGRDPHAWERRALQAALEGAELVWASELAAEREERLAPCLPGFVFVTLLPALDHDGALWASQRTSELAIAADLPGA
ncbi:MAG TPA: hypothetical protein VG448_12565 [Solirubrobacterales bacterium]|nr:hypothetical protein [Solirubrobacterales bacterium]